MIDAATFVAEQRVDADYCVIGSGAGGAVAAKSSVRSGSFSTCKDAGGTMAAKSIALGSFIGGF